MTEDARLPRVVNLHFHSYDIYIGRNRDGTVGKWGNPFRMDDGTQRDDAIARYAEWILTQPQMLAALPELEGKVLGCFCKPLDCHGDVLVELFRRYITQERENGTE